MTLETELERVRERQHDMGAEVAAIRYLALQVRDLAADVKLLTVTARRAIGRPTAGGWSALAGWAGVLLALVAVALALTHGHG